MFSGQNLDTVLQEFIVENLDLTLCNLFNKKILDFYVKFPISKTIIDAKQKLMKALLGL